MQPLHGCGVVTGVRAAAQVCVLSACGVVEREKTSEQARRFQSVCSLHRAATSDRRGTAQATPPLEAAQLLHSCGADDEWPSIRGALATQGSAAEEAHLSRKSVLRSSWPHEPDGVDGGRSAGNSLSLIHI